MQEQGFLGRGFSAPLDLCAGEILPQSGEAKIRASIRTILMTRQGERPLRPDFGSRVWDYVFALPGETTRSLLCTEAQRAITLWEHRVQDVQVATDESELMQGRLFLTVCYTVRATNRPDNLVFPFYLEEP